MLMRVMNLNEHKFKLKDFAISVGIPLAVGGFSALLTKDSMKSFALLRQPPLSPPGWLFPVVWTVLYTLMGIAAYRVWNADAHESRKRRALVIYAAQLIINFFWTIVFFNLGAHLAAFAMIVLLWLLIIACIVMFSHVDDTAGNLMIPYALWVSFAAYLNLGIYLLNK